jgi:hypothetical protein
LQRNLHLSGSSTFLCHDLNKLFKKVLEQRMSDVIFVPSWTGHPSRLKAIWCCKMDSL